MVEPGVYLVLGSVGVTLAGFASLLFSVRRDDKGSPLIGWRVRYIVTGGFVLAIISFAVVAVASFTEDQELIVRVGMVLVLLTNLPMAWSWRSLKDPEVFRNRAETSLWVMGNLLVAAVTMVNLFLASPSLMLALWVFIVVAPTTIFINVVAEIYTPPQGEERPPKV